MSRTYKISELIMNNEEPYYEECEDLKQFKKVRQVENNRKTRYLPWVDDKNMYSIQNPDGRELTPEELFDFVIGENITDLARTNDKKADIAIVLGNALLSTTRQRAIKAFELYRKGIVKKIIFTGGIPEQRDEKGIMHPKNLDEYMDNFEPDIEWQDLPEADWGAEAFVPGAYDEDFKKHSKMLSEDFLRSIKVNPEDVLAESMSRSTQENAIFCKNIFDLLEIETGEKIETAILVTTVTHGSRAMRQFQKLFKDSIQLTWCPSTLDLEKYGNMKQLLSVPEFDQEAFKKELKRIYCTEPELIKKLMEETANHRNAFILGDIYEPSITTIDEDKSNEELAY